jgi:hypothetical protein
MNVVISPGDFNTQLVYFTDKKANTHIPNSTFNRITYSTNDFIMNGIYIQFELNVRSTEKNFNNNIYNCHFDAAHPHNKMVIEIFEKIEVDILQKWNRTHAAITVPVPVPVLVNTNTNTNTNTNAKCRYDIIQQLRDGVISVWKQDLYITDKPQFYHFIIKISGVWENDTDNEYGLTYKCI